MVVYLELADMSPLMTLRKMRELNKGHIEDLFFLKNIWLRRLGVSVQTIWSVRSESLKKLAEMTDTIYECTQVGVNSLDLRGSEQTLFNLKISSSIS